MSDIERAPYEEKARQLKEKLMHEHPDYKYSPRRRGSRDSDQAVAQPAPLHSPLIARRRYSRTQQLLSDDEDLNSSVRSLSPQSYGSSRDTSPARPPILSPQRRASSSAIGRSPQFLTVPQFHHVPPNYSLVLVPNDILHTIQPLMPPMTQVPVAEARPPLSATLRREAYPGRTQQQAGSEKISPPSLVHHGRMQSLPTILPSFSIASQSSELTEESVASMASKERMISGTLSANDTAAIDADTDKNLDGINLQDIMMNDLSAEMAPDEDAIYAWFAEDMATHEADSSLVFEF